MALGRRCEIGCETWPDDDRYATCPVCREETERYRNVEPISAEEAAHRAFDLFYEEWDAASPDGRLAPDAPNAAGRFARSATVVDGADKPPGEPHHSASS